MHLHAHTCVLKVIAILDLIIFVKHSNASNCNYNGNKITIKVEKAVKILSVSVNIILTLKSLKQKRSEINVVEEAYACNIECIKYDVNVSA